MGKVTGFLETEREEPRGDLEWHERVDVMRPKFVKVMPVEYRRAIREMEQKKKRAADLGVAAE